MLMTNETIIEQSLIKQHSGLLNNTTVIDNPDCLDFTKVEEGVLIVYASWSGRAIINSTQTIRTLYEQNYNGQIIVVDINCMTADFQVKIFGQVCHGWGEIFTIHNGKIIKKYLGKDSFINYKTDNDRQL
jgi:hypothetical protein